MTSLTLTLEIELLAVDVVVTDTMLTIKLIDDRLLSVPLNWYPRLLRATPEERENWELLGDGYAIEWVDLDEHIGIEGLLAGRRSGESQQSFDRWLATRTDRGNNITENS
ncbi:MAG: DUF2442 domain-containing protein [Geitlerinemataceae cyanobacterium]